MSKATHRIRQATVEVFADGVNAFRWQQEVAGWTQDRLMPMLEDAFSSLPETESLVCINRLEITVTAHDITQWGDTALQRVRAEVANRLRVHGLAAQSHVMSNRGSDLKIQPEHSATQGHAEEAAQGGVEAILDPILAFARRWSHYLLHGALPWNLDVPSLSALSQQIEKALSDLQGRSESANFEFALELSQVWKYPGARKRFLALPQNLIESILQHLFGLDSDLAAAWTRDASRLIHATSLKGDLGDEILLALAHHPRLFKHGLGDEIAQTYLHRAVSTGHLKGLPPSPQGANLNLESEAFRQAAKHLWASASAQGHLSFAQAGEKVSSLSQSSDFAPPRPVTNQDLDPNRSPESSEFWKAGIYIDHAGLVLAAPFLTPLFERLGLWNQAGSASANPQPALTNPAMALTLLHYLATGNENAAEFQLPLAKVLCGLPIESAFDLPYALSKDQRSEADAALQSLIGHWGALKDTSIDGLREAFLQRPGKLILRENDWFLQVEQRPFDMLLQQLPWSLQFIRLPWMPKFLRTEWME